MAKGFRSAGAMEGLQRLLAELERNRSLLELDRFRERVQELDRLDTYDLDSPPSRGESAESGAELYHRAAMLRAELEAVNSRLYEKIRDAIRCGEGRDALLPWASESGIESDTGGDGYDYLDEMVSGVFQITHPDSPRIELATEMVAYQPTPARHIFEMLRHTKFSEQDVFIDLGSGLGNVPMLVASCTDSRAVGVDIEPAFIECARRNAKALNLVNTTFLAQDAREADLSAGTIFYLYTPFRGSILRTVLDRLRAEGETRQVRVCTFGPCTAAVAAEPWLIRDGSQRSQSSMFRSRK